MTKRKNPYTSKLAHDSIIPAKAAIYKKIIVGLENLRVGGNFEEVAQSAGITPSQAWRRLSELVDLGICFNTGVTHKTSSGRSAMVRQLTSLKIQPEIATKIISSTKVVQQDLFANLNL